jgi:hypothetical protein
MADFALPLPTAHEPIARSGWLARIGYLLRVRARLARRRRIYDLARTAEHDWMLALPQSRHGG